MTGRGTSLDLGPGPVPAAGVHAVDVDGETVIYHEGTGALHLLDPVGSSVWRLLDGRPLAVVCRRLAARYRADPDVVARDVVALVARLRADDVLTSAGEQDADEGEARDQR